MTEQSPTTIAELWIHIQSDQRITRESRSEIKEALGTVNDRLESIEKSVDVQFIRKDYFEAVFTPVRNIVYGMVGTILLLVLTAIVYIVVKT